MAGSLFAHSAAASPTQASLNPMSDVFADARLQRFEDCMSEWDATTRVRVKNPGPILTQAKELQATTKEFWRLKEAVGKAVWSEKSRLLCDCKPRPGLQSLRLHHLVRSFLAPKLAEAEAGGVDSGIWVPLISGKISKRKWKLSLRLSVGRAQAMLRRMTATPGQTAAKGVAVLLVGTAAIDFPSLSPARASGSVLASHFACPLAGLKPSLLILLVSPPT